jgi:spore protease
LTEKAANDIGKPVGLYINIDAPIDMDGETVALAVAKALHAQISGKRILTVGLGNAAFVADSLGAKVLTHIDTNENIMTFEPNVGGVTGINSVDAVKAISNLAKPDVVVVVDSLVARDAGRIGTNYQIADSGITPGSGIGRNNKRLDKNFLGVPVTAIGIPVCTILTTKTGDIMHVVPKDIDAIIANCALVISAALQHCVDVSSL